ncbi:MAG: hypothetical protein BWK80_31200 [Desulfobacteraceae bacterium IS3]|nr:MAG: hypothetical protein BWK80_31200 [Desulfobacteraceae bacterium IS3]
MIRTACLPPQLGDFLKNADAGLHNLSDLKKHSAGFTSSEPHSCDAADILSALNRTGWNKAKAARILGISRSRLYRRLVRYGISVEEGDHN